MGSVDFAGGVMGGGQPGKLCPGCRRPIYRGEAFDRPVYPDSHDTCDDYYHRECRFERFPESLGSVESDRRAWS